MNTLDIIRAEIKASIDVKEKILRDEELLKHIEEAAMLLTDTLRGGGKVLICGNGGSAADAIHIAGELVGRFQKERNSYPAIALNTDVAVLTAIGNDYGYERVFERQVAGLMNPQDILIGISTSGHSANIVRAFERARLIGGKTLLLSGRDGGKLKELADCAVIVPDDVTAHIQEAHVCIYHILCGLVEEALG